MKHYTYFECQHCGAEFPRDRAAQKVKVQMQDPKTGKLMMGVKTIYRCPLPACKSDDLAPYNRSAEDVYLEHRALEGKFK